MKLVTSVLLVFHESGDAESTWQALKSHFTQSHKELAKAAAPRRAFVGWPIQGAIAHLHVSVAWSCTFWDFLSYEEINP